MGRTWAVWLVAAALGCTGGTDDAEYRGGRLLREPVPRPVVEEDGSDDTEGDGSDETPADGGDPGSGDAAGDPGGDAPEIPDEGCIPDALAPPPVTVDFDWDVSCAGLIPVKPGTFTPGQSFGFREPLACDPSAARIPDPTSACAARHLTPEGALKWERALRPVETQVRPPPLFLDWTPVGVPPMDGVFQRTRFYCNGRPAWIEVDLPDADEHSRCAYDVDASGRIAVARFPSVVAGPHHCDALHYAYDGEDRIRATGFDSAARHSGSDTLYFAPDGAAFASLTYRYSLQRFAECSAPAASPAERLTWFRHDNGTQWVTHSATERESGPLGDVLTRTTWWRGQDWSETWRTSARRQYACAGGPLLEERDTDADGVRDEHSTWTLQADGTVRETRFVGETVVEHIDYRFDCGGPN